MLTVALPIARRQASPSVDPNSPNARPTADSVHVPYGHEIRPRASPDADSRAALSSSELLTIPALAPARKRYSVVLPSPAKAVMSPTPDERTSAAVGAR